MIDPTLTVVDLRPASINRLTTMTTTRAMCHMVTKGSKCSVVDDRERDNVCQRDSLRFARRVGPLGSALWTAQELLPLGPRYLINFQVCCLQSYFYKYSISECTSSAKDLTLCSVWRPGSSSCFFMVESNFRLARDRVTFHRTGTNPSGTRTPGLEELAMLSLVWDQTPTKQKQQQHAVLSTTQIDQRRHCPYHGVVLSRGGDSVWRD